MSHTPVIVVTRHPDFADEIQLFGLNAKVIYIDQGSSFDVTKIGPDDRPEVEEWVADHLKELEGIDNPEAELYVKEILSQVMEEVE